MINRILAITVIAISILSLDPQESFSQVTQEWVDRYTSIGHEADSPVKVAVDKSGNIYVTGTSSHSYTTIKYNSSGVRLWVKNIGLYYYATSMVADDSGNVYLTGFFEDQDDIGNFFTVKINSLGHSIWEKSYDSGGNSRDYPTSIAIDNSGNVYVTGFSDNRSDIIEFTTIKYNSSGDFVWVRKYSGPESSATATSIAVDNSGNVYVTGFSLGSGTSSDYLTIKYNSAGDSVWVKRYNGFANSIDGPAAIAIDDSGNVYVTGRSEHIVTDYISTIKYNSSGDSVWVRRYSGTNPYYEGGTALALDNLGNVYVTGSATIKYNSSGDSVWVRRYEDPADYEAASSIVLDDSGNVYVTGQRYYGESTGYDFTTIKYNSFGDSVWVKRYNGSNLMDHSDMAVSIALDHSGNVYVTGYTYDDLTANDWVTIKYSQPTGIEQLSSNTPDQFRLFQNYPNPFNPSTKIRFDVSKSSYIKLVVYDALGRVVAIPVNEDLNAGVYEAEFDGSELSSGVYFYRIQAGEFVETRKMLLLK